MAAIAKKNFWMTKPDVFNVRSQYTKCCVLHFDIHFIENVFGNRKIKMKLRNYETI